MPDCCRLLIINPGSTPTKLSIYENEKETMSLKITHSITEIHQFAKIYDQFDFGLGVILGAIKDRHIDLSTFSAIVAHGGNMKPLCGGTYQVNEEMLADLKIGVMGQHASNLGGGLTCEIAKEYNLKAYVVDPVVVDEFEPLARYPGSPLIDAILLTVGLAYGEMLTG